MADWKNSSADQCKSWPFSYFWQEWQVILNNLNIYPNLFHILFCFNKKISHLALIGGSYLVFRHNSNVSHLEKFKPNCDAEYRNEDIKNWNWSRINDVDRNFEENPIYCDYGLYNFSISLMIMFWLIVGFAIGYFAWIYTGLPRQNQESSKSNE